MTDFRAILSEALPSLPPGELRERVAAALTGGEEGRRGSIREAFEAIRAAGGDCWDGMDDAQIREALGRDEQPLPLAVHIRLALALAVVEAARPFAESFGVASKARRLLSDGAIVDGSASLGECRRLRDALARLDADGKGGSA